MACYQVTLCDSQERKASTRHKRTTPESNETNFDAWIGAQWWPSGFASRPGSNPEHAYQLIIEF